MELFAVVDVGKLRIQLFGVAQVVNHSFEVWNYVKVRVFLKERK